MSVYNMRTVDKVLQLLENNKEDFISGEDMARTHGLSRNAIWKAVRDLRNRGYVIEAISNRGYRLAQGNDIISAEGIRACLPKELGSLADNIEVHDTLRSTSDRAKELAINGGCHGTCIISSSQSRGRGRKDHSFYSPKGGLYMSVILSPDKLRFDKNDVITAFIGVCVCHAIEQLTGRSIHIRGINDLYINDRKICGILIESGSEFDSDDLQWIVAGIGINFDSDVESFPKELRHLVTSLYRPGSAPVSKNDLAAKILENIFAKSTLNEEQIMNEYLHRKKEK